MSPSTPENTSIELPPPTSPMKAEAHAEVEPEATNEVKPEPAEPSAVDVDALVAELRATLASSQTLLSTQATRLSTLTDVETELSQLKDQYAFLAAAKEAVEKQLNEEIKRREMAEENVDLLRGQVEQARRGVGILQAQEKERKRLSFLPNSGLGLNMETEEVLAEAREPAAKTDRASKRASMLVGRAHRRQSSQSEPGESTHAPMREQANMTSPNLSAPRTGGLRELRLGLGNAPSVTGTTVINSPTTSHFDEPTLLPSRPPINRSVSSSSHRAQPVVNLGSAQNSPVKSEEDILRTQLAAARARLVESEEAREASEACLKALREFMAGGGNQGGAADDNLLKTMRLPPLPTDKDADDNAPQELEAGAKKAGWAFKLWKQGPMSPALSTTVEPPATPLEMPTPPRSRRASFANKASPGPTSGELPTENTINAVPVSSTPLGSLVAGWTKTVAPGTPAAVVESKPAPSRSLSSFFSRKKDDAIKEKEKSLPPPPEEAEDDKGGVKAMTGGETGVEPLTPSPLIKDKDIDAENNVRTASETTATAEPARQEDVTETPERDQSEVVFDEQAHVDMGEDKKVDA